MPKRRIVAFVFAVILTLVAIFAAVLIVESAAAEHSRLTEPGGETIGHPLSSLASVLSAVFMTLIVGAAIICESLCGTAGLLLALVNTSPRRCSVKPLRIASWCLFGIDSAALVVSVISIIIVTH